MCENPKCLVIIYFVHLRLYPQHIKQCLAHSESALHLLNAWKAEWVRGLISSWNFCRVMLWFPSQLLPLGPASFSSLLNPTKTTTPHSQCGLLSCGLLSGSQRIRPDKGSDLRTASLLVPPPCAWTSTPRMWWDRWSTAEDGPWQRGCGTVGKSSAWHDVTSSRHRRPP